LAARDLNVMTLSPGKIPSIEVKLFGDETADAPLNGLRCLILGGGGFIGTNLCHALSNRGANVQVFGRTWTIPDAVGPRLVRTNGLFSDEAALARAVEGQEVVFHLISGSLPESSNREPSADLIANVLGTIRLLDICMAEGVRKVIFPSSGGTVYGIPASVPIAETSPTDPITAYGISKLAIEKYLALYHRLHGIDFCVLRIANAYGRHQSPYKRQGVVAALLNRALSRETLEVWGTGEVVRDFIHVDDVVAAFLHALHYNGEHRIMNVGSGVGTSINQIVRDIERLLDRGALMKSYRPSRSADVPVNVLDISLIKRETNWQPRVRWLQGLEDTLRWMVEQ
jgi:UDP-glucose 4-epimerase